MNAAQMVIPGILTPLHGMWRWLLRLSDQSRLAPARGARRAHDLATPSMATNPSGSGAELHCRPPAALQRPLRIVRILELDQAPASVGRMVISGRMADVCAELDRLAALH